MILLFFFKKCLLICYFLNLLFILKYTGIWFLGQIKRGVWDIKDGSYYVGQFEKQRPNKEGKYVMVNRNAVTGQFKEETKAYEIPV